MGLDDLGYLTEQGRCAPEKPVKGAARAERVADRIREEQREQRAKTAARKRDGYRCRWPHCDCEERRDRLEVAHIRDKSLCGENDSANLICLCLARHQGRPSLHSGDLAIRPIDEKDGANGPVEFWYREARGTWFMVARERAIGILERD